MTIWCNACQCHVKTPCTSHNHLSEDQQRASFCRRFRSTKGASKARRDHINHEIRNMRSLLPISADDQERLSYLHSMAAICTYIRKSVLFQGLASKEESQCSLPYEAFLQALHGFILVTTTEGRLVYVSENVVEYLGIAMVDVLQGDSLYDMVERSDIDIVKSNLDFHSSSSPDRSFVCSMQTSKAFKLQNGNCSSMLIQGSFQFFPQPSSSSSSSSCPVSEPLFVSVCSPTVNRLRKSDTQFCHMFSSVHRMDMSFSQVSDSVLFYLGYSSAELTNSSWYSLIHPEDLSLSADSHKTLVQAEEGCQVQMVIRLQCKDLSWCWVYIRANKEAQGISCANHVISKTEAIFLHQKHTSEALGPADQSSSHHPNSKTSKCLKRQRTYSSQSDEPGARKRRDLEMQQCFMVDASSQGEFSPVSMCESPVTFTPPYTPTSSSHDLLVDQLLSSPEPSPPYYSYPQATLTCGQSPSQSPLTLATEPTYDQSPLAPLSSPLSSPSYDFPACAPDARLVPGAVSDVCESPMDFTLHQEDFLEQPHGGDLVHQLHNVPEHTLPIHPSLLTPSQSPTSQDTFEFSERERVEISILAQQIKTLANSFDMLHTYSPVRNPAPTPLMNGQVLAYTWPQHAPLTSAPGFKCELVLDDCVFDSILNELDLVNRKSSSADCGVSAFSSEQRSRSVSSRQESALGLSPDIPPTAEQLTSGGISMDQNNGLHQLNHYIHSSLQQDGLTEENLY